MKHTSADKKKRGVAWRRFLKNNPPRMPEQFTNAEYKRVVGYARAAFGCGFYSGMNHLRKEWE